MPKREYKALSAETKLLLTGRESREVDFKIKAKGVKAEDFVAFANGTGGTILVGVAEKSVAKNRAIGEVVGCDISDESLQSLVSTAASCRPAIDLQIRVENAGTSKPILRIDIPEGDQKPYSTASGTYKIRAEGQNVAIDPNLMKTMILEAESEQFVRRFRAAANDVIRELSKVHAALAEQIDRVEMIADSAQSAAQEARDAAEEAAAAVHDR